MKHLPFATLALAVAGVVSCPNASAQTPTEAKYPWQQVQAKVVADGPVDLVWSPQPFKLEVGKSVRYIDFEGGDDANDGTTPQKAWKHHPWDAAAPQALRGRQAGVDTYVFKRGVTYRGTLAAASSGTAEAPIRLTSDPKWGEGDAVLSGAETVSGPWEQVSDPQAHGLPPAAGGKVWMVKLPEGEQPMLLWVVGGDGKAQRLPIAREPNWRVSDKYRIGSEWRRWSAVAIDYPALTATDSEHLASVPAGSLVGATVWSDPPAAEFSWNPPEPSIVTANEADGTLKFTANHPAKHPVKGSRYFLENLPRFLDEAGEWLCRADGPNAGTLYLWAPDGADPNDRTVEVARRKVIVDIANQGHISLSGLTLRHGNTLPPSAFNSRREGHNLNKPFLNHDLGAVRLLGDVTGVTIANCKVEQTAMGVSTAPLEQGDVLDDITIRDSEFSDIDDGAISFDGGTVWRNTPVGRMVRVDVLRNKITEVGQRTVAGETRGIAVGGGELLHIAGNVVHRTGGQGIDVHVGRSTGGLESQMAKMGERPLSRALIHHNKATETLLCIQDFGGIESWNSGPSYVFNNISAVPVGWIRHNDWFHKNEAFYFDHQFKGYFFNNIGWGARHDDAWDKTMSASFFNQAQGTTTSVFHNSAYRFRTGFYKMTARNNRDAFLANLGIGMTGSFLGHDKLKGNTTNAYDRNLVVGKPKTIYSFFKGDKFETIDAFRSFLADQKMIATNFGAQVDGPVVVDAEAMDFRPLPDSPAVDNGVKVFVPWGLYAVTGEWNFRRHNADPTTVVGENLFISHEHKKGGEEFNDFPRNDLVVTGASAGDYEAGTLEDWVDGALKFDGKRVAVQQKLGRKYAVTDLDIADNSFLVEAVVRVDRDAGDAQLAGKLSDTAGYALQVRGSKVGLVVRAGGRDAEVAGPTLEAGRWYHVIGEADRKAGVLRLYVDGKLAAEQPAKLDTTASLGNDATFSVGQGLIGAIDFLRVSRGSLADARTTIDELYAWQFDGPHLRDFAGRAPAEGKRRTVGALEPAQGR